MTPDSPWVQDATQSPEPIEPSASSDWPAGEEVKSGDAYNNSLTNALPPPDTRFMSDPSTGSGNSDTDGYIEPGGDPNSFATGDNCSGACTAQ